MYINGISGYTKSGEQTAKGDFLILFQQTVGCEIRAIVRSVRMRECGHFMMGEVKLGAHRITLSGTYGSDGSPLALDSYPGLWEHLVSVPPEVQNAWANRSGGWNSAGSEGPALANWARANLQTLRAKVPLAKPQRVAGNYLRPLWISQESVYCRNASVLGYGKSDAYPGDLVRWHDSAEEPADRIGRVLGKVTRVEGQGPEERDMRGDLLVLVLAAGAHTAFWRIVQPSRVCEVSRVPTAFAAWFFAPTLPDIDTIVRRMDRGELSDRYIAGV